MRGVDGVKGPTGAEGPMGAGLPQKSMCSKWVLIEGPKQFSKILHDYAPFEIVKNK